MNIHYLIPAILIAALSAKGQYCMLPGQTPYAPQQPGITNFKLNTINRTSGNSESTASVVVSTGLSTTLSPGQTYTISISHSEDASFFPGARNNLRVWIDYNNNFSHLDAGETVLSVDLQPPATTYTATFTVPATTPAGTFALRATAKMSSDAGHTIPTPCNVPADPLGYHGEMEDYFVVVESQPAAPTAAFAMNASVCVTSAVNTTNTSVGTPPPTYSWSATPAGGVTFSPSATAASPKVTFTTSGIYTISCSATNSVGTTASTKTLSVKLCTFAAIPEAGEAIFSVKPNPASDMMEIAATAGVASVELISVTGALVLTPQPADAGSGSVKLVVSSVPPGIYFLRVSVSDQIFYRRILVTH